MVYGAAEFSRDTDLAISGEPANLERLQRALDELQAERIAVPPFREEFLAEGLAVHFRCHHPEAQNLRVDVMTRMRGLAPFPELWQRRTTVGELELLSLPDLVQAKKTQRDKDWPMLARLVQANYFANQQDPSVEQLTFWLRELRDAPLLLEVRARYPEAARQLAAERPLLGLTDEAELRAALLQEELAERERDREYWRPLKARLEQLRRERS